MTKSPTALVKKSVGILSVVRTINLMDNTSAGPISAALFRGEWMEAWDRLKTAADDFFKSESEKRAFLDIIIQYGLFNVAITLAAMLGRVVKDFVLDLTGTKPKKVGAKKK